MSRNFATTLFEIKSLKFQPPALLICTLAWQDFATNASMGVWVCVCERERVGECESKGQS